MSYLRFHPGDVVTIDPALYLIEGLWDDHDKPFTIDRPYVVARYVEEDEFFWEGQSLTCVVLVNDQGLVAMVDQKWLRAAPSKLPQWW
jgi:hypothetical protein